MKNRMKKFLVLFVCICMLLSGTVYAQGKSAGADSTEASTEKDVENMETDDTETNEPGVSVDEANFPDANFRSYVNEFDADGDGILSAEEIDAVTEIDVAGDYDARGDISDLTGIAHFTSLEYLDCYCNQLTKLDVSKNANLTILNCGGNQLTNLNVSGAVKLTELYCYDNELAELNLENNAGLIVLSCFDNRLKNLNVNKNEELAYLWCSDNKLTSLDVRNCTALVDLDVTPLKKENVQYTAEPWNFHYDGYLGSDKMKGLHIVNYTDLVKIRTGTGEIDGKAICKTFGIGENDDAELRLEQLEVSIEDESRIMDYAEQFGDRVLVSYGVEMNLYLDNDIHYGTIADNFGKLKLSFYVGKEYTGEAAAVYQLHGTDEIIPHKDLVVDKYGMVSIEVTKLSSFGIALQNVDSGAADDGDAPPEAGSGTVDNANPPETNTGTGGPGNGAVGADNTSNNPGNDAVNANGAAPKTGDSAHMAVWIVLVVLTMAAIPIVARGMQKR